MTVFEKKVLVRGFQFVRSTEDEIDVAGSEAYDQQTKIGVDLPDLYTRGLEMIENHSNTVWDEYETEGPNEPEVSLYISQTWYWGGVRQDTQEFHLKPGDWLIEDADAYSGYSVYSPAKIEELDFRKIE